MEAAGNGGDAVEQALKRTERTWIARLVARTGPEIIETETDYLISIGSSQPAFLVFINPYASPAASAREVVMLVARAQRERGRWPVCRIGRAAVVEFNGAWGSPALVDDLATLLVRHQLGGPVPTLLPRSRLSRALHAMRAWIRALTASHQETDQAAGVADLPAPDPMPSPVTAAEAEGPDQVVATAWRTGAEQS